MISPSSTKPANSHVGSTALIASTMSRVSRPCPPAPTMTSSRIVRLGLGHERVVRVVTFDAGAAR